jgi:predicted small secreted protein
MKIISAFLLALSALSLSACNTIEGMGKDIKGRW